MSGSASNLLQLWYIPSTKLFIRTSMLPKTKGLFPEARKQVNAPSMFFCRNLQTTTYEVVKGSYVPVTQTKSETANEEKTPRKLESVGAFQRLPMVKPSVDILYSALRQAKKISPTKGIVNIAKRERNRGARQLDALTKELGIPLREYLENFPNKKYLHHYERSLIELTLGDGKYEEVLGRVNALKKKVVSVGKEHASLCAKSTTKREAEERLSEGMKKLEAIFKLEAKAVDDLLNIAKVCNYPFTTRGILMGHITVNYQRFQVTDTPGLLRRCDDDRNNLEKLTLAVLSHLPTAVLYVHDLTGECGTSPSNQYIIYKEVRERFSNHLWVDVVSKCDLLQKSPVDNITEDGDEDSLEMARYRKAGPEGAILVSVKTETGLDELKSRVHDMLISQLDKLKSESASPES
ncbi:hypothetical protein AQUCO_04400050v1 [Aquilegia coerulea]|uniref:Nucleolar GTP-binding protein 1 Rossman-fold domain-containing protein n=1 Tax=Aquilegia coerulea TaxID=218851 RepID=A0A2G5CMR1_AQUCA|nr:hypothetical protein AQUCO_04400050v1 [Aquilegia coerulea]